MAIWFRRSHPLAVGVIAGAMSLVSGVAGGPALVALFNVAVRGSRRAILAVVALALASTAIFPLLYAGGESYGFQIVLGMLITGVVVGWGMFVRVQRELVLSLRERAATLEPSSACAWSRRARPSACASPARCTTCWPTASRC